MGPTIAGGGNLRSGQGIHQGWFSDPGPADKAHCQETGFHGVESVEKRLPFGLKLTVFLGCERQKHPVIQKSADAVEIGSNFLDKRFHEDIGSSAVFIGWIRV